jgi:RsiW-degrading membrane proteinase PrsW (M82 family)
MVEYYPSIYKRKYCGGETAAENGGLTADFGGGSGGTVDSTTSGRLLPPLSKLSLRILHLWFVLSFLMLAWGVVGPLYWKYIVRTGNRSHAFALADFGIYLLTFVEAIAVLLLARLLLIAISRHSSPTIACKPPLELSADAMIKYFASGFLLSTSLAVFWELMGALLLKITVAILLAASGIGIAADPDTDRTMTTIHMATPASRNYHNEGYEYNGHHHHHPTRGGGASFLEPFWWSAEPASSTKDFMQVFGQDHPVIYTFYLLLNAFVLAALIEEVCKYFGYRMVEHPDLMSRWDLERASHVVHASADDEEEEGEGDAGYFEYDDASRSQNSRRQIHFRQQEEVNRKRRAQRSQDYSKQRPSVQATGASMTLAMVSVAMGFTCCENLVYVFLYSSNSPRMELYVLMSRTLFPVHPIAAALQSVGVCRRDLEGAAVSLWRIVLPAVLFHGAYDFFILWVDFLDKRHGVHADEGSEQVSVVAVAVSFVVSVLILLTALVHLWRQGRQQRQRLAEIDRQASHRLSGLL